MPLQILLVQFELGKMLSLEAHQTPAYPHLPTNGDRSLLLPLIDSLESCH